MSALFPSEIPKIQSIIYPPLIVPGHLPVLEVVRQMQHHSLAAPTSDPDGMAVNPTCAFVVEGTELRGMFTEKDVFRWIAEGRSLAEMTLADAMTTPAIWVRESELDDLAVPLGLMQQHQTHHLAVVDEHDRLVGVIASENLQALLGQQLQTYQAQLQQQEAEAVSLRKSEANHQSLLNALPDLILRISAEGVYLDCVLSHNFHTYCRDDALVGKRLDDSLPADIATLRRSYIQRALETGELQIYEQQLRVDGSLRTEEVRIAVCGDGEVLVVIRDITERKMLEATMQAIIQSSPDILLRVSGDGTYLDAITPSRGFDLFGPRANLVGRRMVDVLPPELAQRQLNAIQRALETQELQTYEQELLVGDRLQYEEVRVICSGDNEVLFIIRDISDRKQAELALHQLNQELEVRANQRAAALRDSEERWQLALQGSDASLWDWNMRTNEVFRSARWCELRGLTEEEVGNHQEEWSSYIHPEDRDRVLATFADHLAKKTPFYQEEYRICCKDGSYIWIQDRGQAHWDETGTPVRIIGSEVDVSRRKQAELESQVLRERLQFVLSSSPAVIFTCQPSGGYVPTFISDNIANLSGYSAEEFLADPGFWANHIHPEDAPPFFTALPALVEEGQQIHEYRFLHRAGHYQWVRNELRLIRGDQGDPIEIVGYLADITDHKLAEDKLRQSQAALAEAQRIAHLGNWEFDALTHQILWSDELFRIFRLDPSGPEPSYVDHLEFFVPEDRELLQRCVDQAVRDGTPYEIGLRIVRADGTTGYLEAQGEARLNAQGQVEKLFGTALDVTARKAAEAKLQQLSERLSLALRSGAIGCWDWDIQRNQIVWDERMYQLYGISASASESLVPYEVWASRVHPDDRAATEALLHQTVLGQAVYEPEFRVIHPDDSIHYIKAYGMVTCDAEGNPQSMIGINFDITLHKQAEERLQRINERLTLTNAELDRATRLKDEFLANMSHELRTPLNAILGMSEGLQEGVFAPLSDRQRHAVSIIERSGKHLLELINDILDLSKIEAGKLELQTAPVAVRYLCDSSLNFIKQQALQKRIQLIMDVSRQLPDIAVDERRIRQVLINLLGNAVKFTPEGGSVRLTAQVEHEPGQSILCLSVLDTGIGIAPEDLGKLFRPFTQIDSRLNRQYSGTGLGLALIRRLVELHRGTVTVTSELHRGSCFVVRLPYDVAIPPERSPLSSPQASTISIDNDRVLVIEDSIAAAEQISRYLHEQHLQPIVHIRGEGAIEKALDIQPTLIILDVLLPNLSGWDVLQQLKDHPQTQSIPVIMISVVDERSHGLALGASEYLVKPITREQFQAVLARLRHSTHAASSPALVTTPSESDGEAVSPPLILLAEDNEMNVATISSYLDGLGYRLIYATNGQEAIEQTRTHSPDLILMDIQMPVMDGLDAIRQIRQNVQFVDLPIIALTALAMPGDRERCLQAGANHYITKPIRMKQLKTLIQDLLQRTPD